MQITLLQAILIGLWAAFCLSGVLFGTYTYRALVISFGVGIILGDLPTALSMGAIAELAFMGFGVGAGGTVPPSPLGPGIFGTLLAITSKGKIDVPTAFTLSIPFAIAIQFIITASYTLQSGTSQLAKKAIEEGKYKKFVFYANFTVIVLVVLGFLIGTISAISTGSIKYLVELLPKFLIDGLSMAGAMLPAVGFALILSVMMKKEVIPFLFLGYVLAAYMELPIMGIALFALVFALYHYNFEKNKSEKENTLEPAVEQEGRFDDDF